MTSLLNKKERYFQLASKIEDFFGEMAVIYDETFSKASEFCYTKFRCDKISLAIFEISHGILEDNLALEFKLSLLPPYNQGCDNFYLNIDVFKPTYEEIDGLLGKENIDISVNDEYIIQYVKISPKNTVDIASFFEKNNLICVDKMKELIGENEVIDEDYLSEMIESIKSVIEDKEDSNLLYAYEGGDEIKFLKSYMLKQKALHLDNCLPRKDLINKVSKV